MGRFCQSSKGITFNLVNDWYVRSYVEWKCNKIWDNCKRNPSLTKAEIPKSLYFERKHLLEGKSLTNGKRPNKRSR